jgi:hypothetical protein
MYALQLRQKTYFIGTISLGFCHEHWVCPSTTKKFLYVLINEGVLVKN